MSKEKEMETTEPAPTDDPDVVSTRAVQIREQIQNAKSQGVTPRQPYEFQEEIASLIPTAGTLETTDEQEAVLNEPVDEADVEIRPDGLLYLPSHKYQYRLCKAFKRRWALVKQGKTYKEGDLILQAYFLVVDGKYITDAIGEQLYQPTNPTMSYGDAIEGAWSNALMRCCKHLGMSRELWDKNYIERWKAKYAESYNDQRTGKTRWRKKGGITHTEKAQAKAEELRKKLEETETSELLITDAQLKEFHSICSERKIPVEICKRYLKNFYNVASSKEIKTDWYTDIVEWANNWREIK